VRKPDDLRSGTVIYLSGGRTEAAVPVNYLNVGTNNHVAKEPPFYPGPTPLLPAAQSAMAAYSAHHRTADFRALYSRVLADLKVFVGTANDCLLLAASGTGAMEAAVSNLTPPATGCWSSRQENSESGGASRQGLRMLVEMVSANYGETVSMADVRSKLAGDVRAVYMQSTESSTGARHDVHAVARLLHGSDTLLVVDAITGLGYYQL